jgi:hypothetical protein
MAIRRYDLLLAGGIIALSAWAVWAQVGKDPVGAAVVAQEPGRLDIGDPLEDQWVLDGAEKRHRLHSLMGKKATVFYAWSTTCPCVGFVDERLIPVIQRFKPLGVTFLAVAGDAKDSPNKVAETLMGAWAAEKLASKANNRGLPLYGMLLDPSQKVCRQLGFREATQFAIVDANGNLHYRGMFDDDLKKPTKSYLPDALEAVVDGRMPDHPLRPVPGYGCPFGEPAMDCPADKPQ